MLIRIPRSWEIPEREATPEEVYLNRRTLLRNLGMAGLGIAAGSSLLSGCRAYDTPAILPGYTGGPDVYPAKPNPRYTLDRDVTGETLAARYNNFYEFSADKSEVWRLTDEFVTRPWTLEVTGLVHRPKTYDLDDLLARMPLEERLYRHRCVEAWSMAVPWTGFPLSALLREVEPQPAATHVRFISFLRPEQAPGQKKQSWYPWPYFEGLTLAEARHELALLVTGIYGHALPKSHGAPIRLVTPWKYGFKSIKSIVRIELIDHQPETFWHQLQPEEYTFQANVEPHLPHPRWSQATERLLGEFGRRPTLLYNGYADLVGGLYRG